MTSHPVGSPSLPQAIRLNTAEGLGHCKVLIDRGQGLGGGSQRETRGKFCKFCIL